MNRFKYVILLLLIFSFGRGCTGANREYSSVSKFNCASTPQGEIIPGTPDIRMFVSNCHDYFYDKNKMAMALNMFVDQYSEEFDIPKYQLWEQLRHLKIEVSAIPKTVANAYDIDGKPVTDVHVSGLALSASHIWVEIKTKQIWSSSLVHELVHVIIWRSNKVHGDPDHEGKEFSGWSKKHTVFIKRFNQKLQDLEL